MFGYSMYIEQTHYTISSIDYSFKLNGGGGSHNAELPSHLYPLKFKIFHYSTKNCFRGQTNVVLRRVSNLKSTVKTDFSEKIVLFKNNY